MFKVMIVDDEWIVREGLKLTIPWKDMQCQVVAEAGNGREALRLFYETRPDIVLTDIRMPDMDGLAFAKEIGKEQGNVATIFLTGFDEFSYAQEAIKAGAFELLLKPSDPDELQRVVVNAAHKITIQRQQSDYRHMLEQHQKTSQPFVLEKVLQRLVLDTATIEEMTLLYESLEGRLELFDHYRLAVLDEVGREGRSRSRSPYDSRAGSFLMQHAITEPIEIDGRTYGILLNESGGSKWRAAWDEWTAGNEGEEIRLSLSRVHRGLLTLGQAYSEVCLARFHHALASCPPVLDYETIASEAGHSAEWDESEFVEALKWGTREAIGDALQTLCKSVVWQDDGREMKQGRIGTHLLLVVYHVLNRHFRETGGLPELPRAMEELERLPTNEAVLAWLESMVIEVRSMYIASKSKSRSEMDDIIEYVDAHFTEELKMYELADRLHMSESKFSKQFKREIGVSFQDYVTERRIAMAKELLLDPELRIGEIARMVGYQETRYFGQLFKKTTGETQKSFRRKVRELLDRKEK